jgi:hypothetical protein
MAHSNKDKRRAIRRAQKVSRKAAWATLIGTSRNKRLNKLAAETKRLKTNYEEVYSLFLFGKRS